MQITIKAKPIENGEDFIGCGFLATDDNAQQVIFMLNADGHGIYKSKLIGDKLSQNATKRFTPKEAWIAMGINLGILSPDETID